MLFLKRYSYYQKTPTFYSNLLNNPIAGEVKTVIPRANNLNLNLKFKTYFRFNFFNRVKRLAFKKQICFFYDWYFLNDKDFKIIIEKSNIYFFYKKNIYENFKYYNFVFFLCKRWFLSLDKKHV